MFKTYEIESFFDEMLQEIGRPRSHYQTLYDRLSDLPDEELKTRHEAAQQNFLRQGITFTVYNDNQGSERTIPFDFVPNIIPKDEWKKLEEGLIQRVKALNLFLDDIYNDQQILKDGLIPRELVVTCNHFYPQVAKIKVPRRNHIFMAGIDLVKDDNGEFRVLEDNLRNPSGLSYVFQNRYVMRHIFSDFFHDYEVQSLENQFTHIHEALSSIAPNGVSNPNIVLLTPGIYNSAYFDHSFIAQQLGIELVEGRDLLIRDRVVYMKTTRGLKRVDVIYRRIDDDFLDPLEFRPDSMLGVPGLIDAYRAGNVTISNGIGNGVADDKAIYHYVPNMIRYYLGEEPMIKNVETYFLRDEEQRNYVLENLDKLVVKQTDGSGGYNLLIGPHASQEERDAYRVQIEKNPNNYIAQPMIKLSRLPVFRGEKFSGCHIDLRAYIFNGEKPHVFPGGLTRVALKEGSMVVNSSQGGGGKDTWVMTE
ncbi:circularly permuted type 2 ATP-grasp protein [Pseudalkalibacillus berkeleyi]|uniref:Circularly permuted type 2 ATP-grasp protein n=1 Tax=Pseudalkalibacillus berkeleyi TaxID=1069813 RepID=A0ABS9H4Y9_9BACL|nr:circularly permuted type 2 ATP-grasp protein [Pseudalkalibacillus berkeleyi]MCF6138875.1 circularly permuted type 2 ATP-grasp protein [Pseudalkalibacillus berkeleyi]